MTSRLRHESRRGVRVFLDDNAGLDAYARLLEVGKQTGRRLGAADGERRVGEVVALHPSAAEG